ncbi:SGNH/GDSL hydrolase family protein [Bradyrhizobium sp. 2TAF24]|uniref:SGNH/GDSL hydrolase family protein n=1 Tax=Bradyrhizobium sp. 2TAF24 TaxID=3233011 RepID=UPI003F93258D
MPRRSPLRRILSEAGPLIAAATAAVMLFGIVAPASAQFFDFGFGRPPPRQAPQRGGGGFGGFFSPFREIFPGPAPAPQQQRAVDYSHAPPAEKRETPAERNVLVLGDAMADWLAYGLEDAFSEQPDMGVVRKHKTVSGLIRYQPKGEPADWAAAARGILAAEKADAIVVMLGLNDRVSIREMADPKAPADKKADKDKKDARAKVDGDKPAGTEPPADDADSETPSIAAPEKSARAAGGSAEFRDDRWAELYARKIEDLIAVLKSKGVPVVWVGLPAVRGQKATADMLYLDALYRDGAGKAGITYVDVWDGFVDEAGRFMPQGPDFEGQIRRLRTADGVFFTKAGARKLAHYVEREISRLLARATPVALPNEPAVPDTSVRPGGPPPRPLAGPVVPLVASSIGSDELLGGPGTRPTAVDALAARTLVKGEALSPPAGRADDAAWPRREVGRLEPGNTPVVAAPSAKPDGKADNKADAAPVASAGPEPAGAPTAPPAAPKKRRAAPPSAAEQPSGFFGFDSRPSPPPQQSRPRPRDGAPRPPGSIGRSASAPDDGIFAFTR